jgi:hypothetical protein
VVFVILATYSNEQSDFINRIHGLTLLAEKLPDFKYAFASQSFLFLLIVSCYLIELHFSLILILRALVSLVLTIEVIEWKSFLADVEPLFLGQTQLENVFKTKEDLAQFWEELRLRIIEHVCFHFT